MEERRALAQKIGLKDLALNHLSSQYVAEEAVVAIVEDLKESANVKSRLKSLMETEAMKLKEAAIQYEARKLVMTQLNEISAKLSDIHFDEVITKKKEIMKELATDVANMKQKIVILNARLKQL